MHIDLDDNLVEEERTDGRKDALHIEMTDDIGGIHVHFCFFDNYIY